MAERQVGERLSEEARELSAQISEYLRTVDQDESGPLAQSDQMHHRASILLAELARQLAEAERENGRLREALERIAEWPLELSRFDCEKFARAALTPPDPPASPAEGSEGGTEVEA